MAGRIAILLASYQGARFLPEQLASLARQSCPDWHLYWRDDGSTDASPALLAAFAPERSAQVAAPPGRLGAAASFFALLAAAAGDPENDFFAFCDQDDVWREDKLARARDALEILPAHRPALYCARATLVDATLRRRGALPPFRGSTRFPAALTENIAAGCTMMLNRAAADLIAASRPPAETLHDWWSYLLVSAAGGFILTDAEEVLLYRQHGANVVGAPGSRRARALAALGRGPAPFMARFRAHLGGLAANAARLPEPVADEVAALRQAFDDGLRGRLRLLAWPGIARRTRLETLLLRLWLLLG
jgi:glycosyltransferase involved in cell wall biosynthesis